MRRLIFTAIIILGIVAAACLFINVLSSFAEDGKGESLAKGRGIEVYENLISIDVRDAEIIDVLSEIAQKAKIDFTVGSGIYGKVSMRLTEVTIEEALNRLCQSNALVYEYLPDRKAYRIVGAVAIGGSVEKGKQAADSTTYGPGAKQSLPGLSSDKANKSDELPVSQKDAGLESDKRLRPSYKKGELLVRFRQGATDRQIDDLHSSLGSTVLGSIKNLRLQRIRLREGISEEEATSLYKAADIVEHVEKHALRYPNLNPNDPDFSQQWGLVKIKAPAAWDITQGSQDIIVAIIDTGVDYNHPDLQANIWKNNVELNGLLDFDDDNDGYKDDVRGWDFAGADENHPQGDNNPMDYFDHGTHVAGIVAASGNNGLGVAGVNWRISIMPLKVQADNGSSFLGFAIIEATQYAIRMGAKIVVCSFGGSGDSPEEKTAFQALRDAGILVVCAAGNSGRNTDTTPNFPSSYDFDNIISVAASDSNDNLASFSDYGATSVDLMAPGVDIYSTVPVGTHTNALLRVGGATPPAEFSAIGMKYAGLTGESGITGTAYDCGQGYPEQFPPAVRGNIAIIERSPRSASFTFSAKVTNAQAAGALGVIIYNNVVDSFDMTGGTLGSPGDWVPVISITLANGTALKALVNQGNGPVTLINKPGSGAYGLESGTSMAAPYVAGIAGLVLAQCPTLRYGDIKSAILNTVDIIPAVAGKMVTGGRANAFAALTSLRLTGDLTGDCLIGLDDAILALKILSLSTQGIYPCPSCGPDASGDNKLGLEDVIFIMQKAANLR